MAIIPVVSVIAFLIFVNGLYVAAEFSAVSARRPRLAQMASEGSRAAQSILTILEEPRFLDTYVAACQLGITVSSLVLGYYGQAQLTELVSPLLINWGQSTEVADSIATTVILIGLTILQVVLGELMPKNVGIQYPERLAMLTVIPMRWSMWLFQPLVWVFNGSGALILALFGRSHVAEHAHVHSPEEIRMLVEESGAGGVLQEEEQRLLVNTLELRNLTARKMMIPRNRMITASADLEIDELLVLLANSPYSRLPLYEESVDNVLGVIHLKDLLYLFHHVHTAHPPERAASQDGADNHAARDTKVRSIMHSVAYVPETMPAEDLLTIMQQNHQNMAIVIDEYGGTAGMVTMEDLFEEIIGEFEDEFDPEFASLQLHPGNQVLVRGDVQIEDLNEWLGLNLPTDAADTIGGLIFSELGTLPQVGETVTLTELPSTEYAENDENALEEEDASTPAGEASGVAVVVERMYRNSVAEVKMQVTSEQVAKLHELVHSGINTATDRVG